MSQKRNDLIVVVTFSIIWLAKPISFDEMSSRHPIYQQQNPVIVNISSVSNQNEELNFLEGRTRETILAKGNSFANGYSPGLPERQGSKTTSGIGGSNPGSGNSGSSSTPNSGNLDGTCPLNPTPKFPYPVSPSKPKVSPNPSNPKKNSFEVNIVRGQIVIRVTRDDMPFFFYENTARKKIYHAPDFDVALPDNLDLEYVKSLSPKDRLQYLSNPDILPQECVGEYMKKMAQHLLDPTTEIKVGTLGANGAAKGWKEEVIQGTHAFNPDTGNDIFFADEGFKHHTGMTLNEDQRMDLQDNNNIL